MLIKSGIFLGRSKYGDIYKCPFCGARVIKTKFFYLDFGQCKHVVALDDPEGKPLFSDEPEKARELLLALEDI